MVPYVAWHGSKKTNEFTRAAPAPEFFLSLRGANGSPARRARYRLRDEAIQHGATKPVSLTEKPPNWIVSLAMTRGGRGTVTDPCLHDPRTPFPPLAGRLIQMKIQISVRA
jgi:hypothetical protein